MLLIPGPVTMTDTVVNSLGSNSLSHTGPDFKKIFQRVLQNTRVMFESTHPGDSPVVISGSGTLGFDLFGNNFCEPDDHVLLLSTGYFSDEFGECLQECYGVQLTVLKPDQLGESIKIERIIACLSQQEKTNNFKAVVMTHVDTSSGILLDVASISQQVKRYCPQALIVVDTVCSLGCELFKFSDWNIDVAISASQKALGSAPGLMLGMISERATRMALEKTTHRNMYTSLCKWLPVLRSYEAETANNAVKYFATPPIQLIMSLDTALQERLSKGERELQRYQKQSQWLRDEVRKSSEGSSADQNQSHLSLVVPDDSCAAHALAPIIIDGHNSADAIKRVKTECNAEIAGGIHPQLVGRSVRIGLLGVDAESRSTLGHVLATLAESGL